MSTEWGHPINSLEYQLRKTEELLERTGANLRAAQEEHDAAIAKRDAHAAALRVLKATAEAEGREVEYSPADGEQPRREFRKGDRVKVSNKTPVKELRGEEVEVYEEENSRGIVGVFTLGVQRRTYGIERGDLTFLWPSRVKPF